MTGIGLVKKGITRGYGVYLKSALQNGTKNRFLGFICGLWVTLFLQSSTATILMLSSFAKNHMIPLSGALAVVLGADLATPILAQILTFDLSFLSPCLIIAGYVLHSKGAKKSRRSYLGAICMGLGLMLLSLSLIKGDLGFISSSETLPLILTPLKYDPLIAIIIAALVTWLMHSSLAAILIFAALAATGNIDIQLALYLVLGANLGGALVAFILLIKERPEIKRIAFGNLFMRFALVVGLLPFTAYLVDTIRIYEIDAQTLVIYFHIGFNILLAILFIPIIGFLSTLLERILPDLPEKDDPGEPLFLDEKAMDTPVIALAGAARETLRMAEYVEDMLAKTIVAFEKNDAALVQEIRRDDNLIDRLYRNIKLYMANFYRKNLDEDEAARFVEILTFATNLEYVGDIIDKNLMDLAAKKIKKNENFSDEGLEEIKDFHQKILNNIKLAQNIFMLQDQDLAQKLVASKKKVRKAVKKTSDQHFQRLIEGNSASIATSSLHMDIIRDYRRINTYITAVAYNILETDGVVNK